MKQIIIFISLMVMCLAANAQEQAGKTMIAKGAVAAEAEQDSRKLKRRSPIFDNEKVTTGEKSKAQLRMTDGGMIALKENSELVIANYQYTQETGEGTVAMELLKGGLRSVTGAIKSETGDYNLKTPVGSIGIRGTHFEVEIVGGDLFVAVWDGAIDLTVDTGTGADTVSFGEGEDFSFGVVTGDGEVTQLLEAPNNFDSGHSEDQGSSSDEDEGDDQDGENNGQQGDDTGEQTGLAGNDDSSQQQQDLANEGNEQDNNDIDQGLQEQDESSLATDELDAIGSSDIASLIAEREGTYIYDNVAGADITSTAGGIGNLSMGMTIDFDSGYIPEGSLSFDDANGEWFAAFSGFLLDAEFVLQVGFASHGNNPADGQIDAAFLDDLESISGSFELLDLLTNEVASGAYTIRP